MATETTTTPSRQPTTVQSLTPCLAFADRAEEAVNFYVSIFANSKITNLVYAPEGGPLPSGQLLHATFELQGREYTAMNGGPYFTFTPGFSLVATCQTQDELDTIWNRLAEGGEAGPCGWLTDKFGVSWQVVPKSLGEMMSNPAGGNSTKVMEALMGMTKLDIAALEAAYRQP